MALICLPTARTVPSSSTRTGSIVAFASSYRLLPPRPTFALDMDDAERAVMGEHSAYWRGLMAEGHVVGFGPVNDPNGPYGIAIAIADDLAQAEALGADDPAVRSGLGLTVEIAPMFRLLTPDGEH
jgi:uncharacterized protein YciI